MRLLEFGRNTPFFWLGCLLVTIGVLLHLPMYWMARDMGFVLAGMPMGADMMWGMAAIIAGVGLAGWGLLPRTAAPLPGAPEVETIAPPEDAPLSRAHVGMMVLLAIALVIDIMKPASLGFVTPGMRTEYGVGDVTVAWLPFAALFGTALGSFLWGWLADVYGRRASILLSSVMFIGTAICGTMPDFWWNVFMCFLMGAAAGGMLPVAYALLAEIMPTRHRGWSLVLVGGVGAVGGFFAASALSALLQPTFGWRVMWLLNLPTGLALILLSPLLPESARFLERVGRIDEARAMLARFGARVQRVAAPPPMPESLLPAGALPAVLSGHHLVGVASALTLSGLGWGLVNFGLLLWLPSQLVAEGRSVGAASALIAQSTLLAAPTIAVCTFLYSRWSTKWTLVLMTAIMLAGLAGLAIQDAGPEGMVHPLLPLTLVVVGACGVISILLPYTAENFPIRIRGRATGWVAACSKIGGLFAQGLNVVGIVPAFSVAAVMVGVPALASLLLIAGYGRETRQRDLRELEPAEEAILQPPAARARAPD
ncbi:MAG TPA: MFS transporter [Woeseiaceae bacterium]|nr:MFS transporter [Woeseiaceae bacterium]